MGKAFLKEIGEEYFQVDVLTRNNIKSTTNIRYLEADLLEFETLNTLRTTYDIIVHCASDAKTSGSTDIRGTQNLLRIINRSIIKNLIYISIVGVDKTNYKYYQNKLHTEKVIIDSGVPYTILRVTQFHDFVYNRIINSNNSEDESIAIPGGLKFQSIDLTDVCAEILRLLKNGATNSILQVGGPEILESSGIAKTYQNVTSPEKKISIVPPGNDLQKLFTTGINLCPDHKKGKKTWRDFLLKKNKTPGPISDNQESKL